MGWRGVLVRLVGLGVGGVAGTPLVYMVCITLWPARTPEGYGLMPIGQVMAGMLGGAVLGILAAILAGRWWDARSR